MRMAESRPDEVDFVHTVPKHQRENASRIAESLGKNGVIAGQKSTSKKIHKILISTKKFVEDDEEEEDVSEWVLRFNRLRQEQNVFKKMVGPNYLEAIMAKPKARIPDVNEDSIDPFDDGGFTLDIDIENVDATEKVCQSNHRGTLDPGTMNTINAEYESFDYTEGSSALQYIQAGKRTLTEVLRTDFNRWPLAFLIGILTAVLALGIQLFIEYGTLYKYHFLSMWIQRSYEEDSPHLAYLISLAINVGCCGVATMLCVIAPDAVGSGIPQIKSYLNGVNMPRLMRFKTLVGKAIGVIFSVVGGLAVGKEGPMIHSGSIVAAGISQGKATSLPITTRFNKAYRNDKEKRDFVAAGAAAGVASAFGAPLGGLLFAIEEGASYINHATLWRTAMCAITSFFMLNIFNSILKGIPGQMSNGGLISFGEFDDAYYNFFQLIVFCFMGIFGGLSGALFNELNRRLTQFRISRMNSKYSKVAEVLTCALTVSTLAYTMMYTINDCRSYDVDINETPVRLYCQDGKASAAASLWYKTPEESVRSLFHDMEGAHSFTTLLAFAIFYFFLACWTYGMFISSGLFVPSLLIGAAWGRLTGMALVYYLPEFDWGDLGKFALIGASAQLAGTIRLTYSLTAIILEATGNLTYIFPIFVTVFMAKIIGDFINEGLYDIHINILGIPLLPYEPKVELRTITAKDMMNKNVKTLNIRSSVRETLKTLKETQHNAFPVVDSEIRANNDNTLSYGRMRGLMKRHDIVTMLFHGLYEEDNRFGGVAESYELLREKYPRFVNLNSFVVPEEKMDCTLNFSNAMDSAPYTASSTMLMPAVYNLFRNMGMRHLVIVNVENEVVGMITRKEIAALEPELKPFPNAKITLYKKTSVVNRKRRAAAARIPRDGVVRRRRITLTNSANSYEQF